MSQINFLPDTFRRDQARKRRRPAEFAAIAVTACALVGLWMSTSGPDRSIAQKVDGIDQQIHAVQQLQAQRDQLVGKRSGLQRKLLIARETSQPITATNVLARMSLLAPESVRLVRLELAAERPAPEKRANPQDNKKPTRRRGSRQDPQAGKDQPNLMRVSITGHAPDDDQIVTLIRRLNADPVFSTAALRSSKQEKTKTHYVRKFQLDVTINLDRRFIEVENKQGARDED